jgi:hypothetical protein
MINKMEEKIKSKSTNDKERGRQNNQLRRETESQKSIYGRDM